MSRRGRQPNRTGTNHVCNLSHGHQSDTRPGLDQIKLVAAASVRLRTLNSVVVRRTLPDCSDPGHERDFGAGDRRLPVAHTARERARRLERNLDVALRGCREDQMAFEFALAIHGHDHCRRIFNSGKREYAGGVRDLGADLRRPQTIVSLPLHFHACRGLAVAADHPAADGLALFHCCLSRP